MWPRSPWHLIAVAAALALPRAAADPVVASPFAGDSRFRKPLTLAVKDQPLWELLGHLRAAEGLPVRAGLTTRDERVMLFCRQRPAAEVLQAVAGDLKVSSRPKLLPEGRGLNNRRCWTS